MKKLPQFDDSLCIACGICCQSCPLSCILMARTDVDVYKKAYPKLEQNKCNGCGICATTCPTDAVMIVER